MYVLVYCKLVLIFNRIVSSDYDISDIRLTGGLESNTGYVQVKMNDMWGYVCARQTCTPGQCDVICRTLGYS